MFCDRCGARITTDMLHCPRCGYVLPRARLNSVRVSQWGAMPAASRPRRWWILAVVAVAGILCLGIAGLGIAAVRDGLAERERNIQQVAMIHYERGVALMTYGQWELARDEFKNALKLVPDMEVAQRELAQVEAALSAQTEPTPVPTVQRAEELFAASRVAYDAADWDLAIGQLQQLRQLDPDFRRPEVEDLLFWAAFNRGLQLVKEDQVPEAVTYFDRALAVRPGEPNALGQKQLAALYVEGLRATGDPARAIVAWKALYQRDQTYRDVAERLAQAYIAQGDSVSSDGNWCQAQTAYDQAILIQPSSEARAKAQLARERCAEASAFAIQGTPVPARRFTGKLTSMTDIGGNRIQVRGRVLNAQGRAMAGVNVRISAYDWSATAVTNGNGEFSFDGLKTPARYTLTLPELPASPFELQMDAGKQAVITFTGQK